MKLNVYRDENGIVRNIGEWDYMISTDSNGREIINNPLPPNYTSKIENINENEDGSRSVID